MATKFNKQGINYSCSNTDYENWIFWISLNWKGFGWIFSEFLEILSATYSILFSSIHS